MRALSHHFTRPAARQWKSQQRQQPDRSALRLCSGRAALRHAPIILQHAPSTTTTTHTCSRLVRGRRHPGGAAAAGRRREDRAQRQQQRRGAQEAARPAAQGSCSGGGQPEGAAARVPGPAAGSQPAGPPPGRRQCGVPLRGVHSPRLGSGRMHAAAACLHARQSMLRTHTHTHSFFQLINFSTPPVGWRPGLLRRPTTGAPSVCQWSAAYGTVN